MARTRTPEVDHQAHLGGGTGRTVNKYKPNLTHEDIDRLLSADGPSAIGGEVVTFNMVEDVQLSPTDVGFHVFEVGRILYRVRVNLTVAGTTNTVVTIYKNGDSIGTVTVTSGNRTAFSDFSVPFTADDELSARVTTAGVGAYELVCIARAA